MRTCNAVGISNSESNTFLISFMVDALVVTLLLRLVHRQQRQLRESEERYRALFEQARDGIGVVRSPITIWLKPITEFVKFSVSRNRSASTETSASLFRTSTTASAIAAHDVV